MTQLHELAKRLQELDDQLANCMKCGMCQAVCPVFGKTGLEGDVTRGKISLLEGLAAEILKNPRGVDEQLNRCLMCGTCEANCPSGVKISDIFFKARIIMTDYHGLSWVKKMIFRGMLSNPRFFDGLVKLGSTFQGIFTRKVDPLLDTSCAAINLSILQDRHFNTLAKKALHQEVPELDTPAGKRGLRVAFFTGCMIDKVYPSVGLAAIEILKNNGVGIFLPANQACCGIPALTSGDKKTFEKLTAMNLKIFNQGQFDYLVTTCASCTSTVKELWPKMYDGDAKLRAFAQTLAEKTMDISQFLVDVLGIDEYPSANGKKVTYHDPCHLKNSLHIIGQPRALIEASGQTLVEMKDAGKCCGCGGSFNVQHYDLSKMIGQEKAKNICAANADIVATSCPACMLQISDQLSHVKKNLEVKHVVELYAEAMKQKE